ncbi:MAG TPA: cyclase family protein [Bacteroidia bacterium]|jgi:arylformamidase|nr:cyclase family protein [Bacteroidia bacterium]
MFVSIQHKGKNYRADLGKPIDISIPLRAGKHNVNAWNAQPVKIEPVHVGNWVGEVKSGAPVNFRNIFFNPHGNGTHTECVGHISKEDYSINQCLKEFFFIAEVISILPDELPNGDKVITDKHIMNCLGDKRPEALIVRTISNPVAKMNIQYSGTNPPYLTNEAMSYIVSLGISHFLIDLPSVDREDDGGKLSCHHIFWNYPQDTKQERTITEFIYVPNTVFDGAYLLNLQIASFENDATPSKPVLFQLVV